MCAEDMHASLPISQGSLSQVIKARERVWGGNPQGQGEMLSSPSGHIHELAERPFSSREGLWVSSLSPSLFLKPPVPGLGD